MPTFHHVGIDGSGTFNRHKAIAYAGAKATPAQFADLAESWRNVLVRENLTYFKMAEAMSWHGQFISKYSKWGEDREQHRDCLLNELADLALGSGFTAVGTWADVRLLAEDAVADKKAEVFASVVLGLLERIPEDNYVTLMCDEELDLEAKVRAWLHTARTRHVKGIAPITGVCYLDDRVYPPCN
jgi:hypothetical protein